MPEDGSEDAGVKFRKEHLSEKPDSDEITFLDCEDRVKNRFFSPDWENPDQKP